jgi:acetyl-CoA synthetase
MWCVHVDVINVSGHRLSTAEIESALILHPSCAESAVVAVPDDLTGESIVCFCTLKTPLPTTPDALNSLIGAFKAQVRSHIGPFATPKAVYFAADLPKTRSGKIMRRILRKIAGRDVVLEDFVGVGGGAVGSEKVRAVLGDVSTLADPSVVEALVKAVNGV